MTSYYIVPRTSHVERCARRRGYFIYKTLEGVRKSKETINKAAVDVVGEPCLRFCAAHSSHEAIERSLREARGSMARHNCMPMNLTLG